ncbi:MAG: F0F1 ATP synthase subunit alpha, partial [Erysipelotrichaceae bacterium]
LLERAAKLNDELGGGSLTALPLIETQAGDISAYIPTNVISITDGQIFLQTELFNAGNRPAVDSGLSVSRVGSSAQIKAMKQVAGSLKLELAQYTEMQAFSKFGSDLDNATKATLAHGERLTELLKQNQYEPMNVYDQILSLFSAKYGYLKEVKVSEIKMYEKAMLKYMNANYQDIYKELIDKQAIDEELSTRIKDALAKFSIEFNSIHGN